MSPQRIERDLKQTNWERKIEILTLKNQGWSDEKIGNKLGISQQAVNKHYNAISHLTVQELEEKYNNL